MKRIGETEENDGQHGLLLLDWYPKGKWITGSGMNLWRWTSLTETHKNYLRLTWSWCSLPQSFFCLSILSGSGTGQLLISKDFSEHASRTRPELQSGVAKGWPSSSGVARQMITTKICVQALSVIKAWSCVISQRRWASILLSPAMAPIYVITPRNSPRL